MAQLFPVPLDLCPFPDNITLAHSTDQQERAHLVVERELCEVHVTFDLNSDSIVMLQKKIFAFEASVNCQESLVRQVLHQGGHLCMRLLL